MIFKRLFTPAHTSSDPAVRKAAIDKLSADKQQDKAILHELAFNDESAEVTLAALHKLDSFVLWQKSTQITRHEQVQRSARQYVETAVLQDTHPALSARERFDYLLETATPELVKAALLKPLSGLDNSQRLQLLDKVGREDVTLEVYQQVADVALREQIIARTDSQALLEKLAKKETVAELEQQLQKKLDSFAEAAKMPALVNKEVTLLLAKLKALLERGRYEDVLQRYEQLEAQYAALSQQLHWLDSEAQAIVREKHNTLQAQAQRHLARLKPQWEASKAAEAQLRQYSSAQAAREQANTAVHSLYAGNVEAITLDQVSQAQTSVNTFGESLDALIKNDSAAAPDTGKGSATIEQMQRELAILRNKVEQFGEQQQLSEQLAQLLVQAGEEPETDIDIVEYRKNLTQQWQSLSKRLYVVPAPLKQQWRDISGQWKAQEQARRQQSEQALKACRRQLNIVDNMIEQGKFRAAMARYSQLAKDYAALDDSDKARLARRFDTTREQIERLEGWQHYLAAPRKPELLEQARQLAAEPADDIGQRAGTIKRLRQQWQSLTHPGEKSDSHQAFNEALEQAFAPCREFYAEQDKLRAQARSHRLALIEQVGSLDAASMPVQALQREMESLKQAWRNAGQVDKQDYDTLKQQWDDALATPAARISEWHQQNRLQKQALIEQAQSLLEHDIDEQSASTAQALQQQWKTIGHAGRRQESRLWTTFKSINDSVFAKLKETNAAQRNATDEAGAKMVAQAEQFLTDLTPDTLAEVRVGAAVLQTQAKKLQSQSAHKVFKALRRVQNAVSELEQARQHELAAAQYRALLKAVDQYTDSEESVSTQIDSTIWDALGRSHQQALLVNSTDKDRAWYTTKLEILAELPTPAEHASLRQDIQLAMMMAKLEQGEETSIEEAICQWLSCGPVTSQQTALKTRFSEVITQLYIAGAPSDEDIADENSD